VTPSTFNPHRQVNSARKQHTNTTSYDIKHAIQHPLYLILGNFTWEYAGQRHAVLNMSFSSIPGGFIRVCFRQQKVSNMPADVFNI
jgi:hypothetical protein